MENASGIVAGIAAGGVLVFTVGLVLSSLTILLLDLCRRIACCVRRCCGPLIDRVKGYQLIRWAGRVTECLPGCFLWDYLTQIPESCRDTAKNKCGFEQDNWNKMLGNDTRLDLLYPTTTFQHWKVSEAMKDWMSRRWNAFMVYANSFFGVLFATILAGCVLKLQPPGIAYCVAVVLMFTFFWNACVCWTEVKQMTIFLLSCKQGEPSQPDAKP